MTDLQMVFLKMDEDCSHNLSQAKTCREKKQWAKGDFQLHSELV